MSQTYKSALKSLKNSIDMNMGYMNIQEFVKLIKFSEMTVDIAQRSNFRKDAQAYLSERIKTVFIS